MTKRGWSFGRDTSPSPLWQWLAMQRFVLWETNWGADNDLLVHKIPFQATSAHSCHTTDSGDLMSPPTGGVIQCHTTTVIR